MFNLSLLFLIFLGFTIVNGSNIGAYQIKDFKLNRCVNTEDDPISLDNVTISFANELTPLVTGIFSTKIDLTPPVKVHTLMERKIIFWIIMPCIDNLGSCTFDDICKYGTPTNENCPTIFQSLPCRCPIKKGTYIIPERISNIFQESSVYTGTYKGTINISSNGTQLACYDTSFEIYDS